MPIPSNPPRLTNILGYGADISTIPATTPSGSGAFSYQSGFPAITAIPLTAGGIAPSREDFNAVIKLMSQHLFFLQSGSLYTWNSSLDYLPGAHVLGSNGQEYVAVQSSGPDTSAKAQNPVNDTDGTYWKKSSFVELSSSVNSTSETTAATSKAVKTAYDAALAAQKKANSAYTEATTEASTKQAGRVQLSDSVSSTSNTTAATSKAVKTAYDKAVAGAGVKLKGSRTATGTWTLTGLTVGKLLFILGTSTAENVDDGCMFFKTVTGAAEGLRGTASYLSGVAKTYSSTNVFVVVPTATTVSFEISEKYGVYTLKAYQ